MGKKKFPFVKTLKQVLF